jgi:hypothetical protein
MQAFDVALKIYRRPNLVPAERRKPLPLDILPLIRIAGGSEVMPEFLTTERAKNESEAREACVFFLQQMLLSSKSDEYRQLGLNPRATLEQINEHKRYLLKWLHPDRNPNKWESAMFQRVSNVAEKLEKELTQHKIDNNSVAAQNKKNRKTQPKLSRYTIQSKEPTKKRIRLFYVRFILLTLAILCLALIWKFYGERLFDWFEVQATVRRPIQIGGEQLMSFRA